MCCERDSFFLNSPHYYDNCYTFVQLAYVVYFTVDLICSANCAEDTYIPSFQGIYGYHCQMDFYNNGNNCDIRTTLVAIDLNL